MTNSKQTTEVNVEKVYNFMKRCSSKTTGMVSKSRIEIADSLGLNARVIDSAIATMKERKLIKRVGHKYALRLKRSK